ncbi:MAG: NAD(P)H-binding protein [Thermomicrobiales bacterium]
MIRTPVHPKPVLVVGSSGKTGSRVATRLRARGVPVRDGSRQASPPFDWENPATWGPPLEGTGAVYLTYAPDLAVPGAIAAIETFTRLARAAGVQGVVLLSGRGEPEAQAAEQILQESGIPWTILRCAWFMQNFSEGYLREPVLEGAVMLPAGDIGEPFIDADDIADVAVAALTEAGHAERLYELTGPRLLTFADATAGIAAATRRPVAYQTISMAEYLPALTEAGAPPDVVWLIEYLFSTVLDGRNASLANGVQDALGRPPRDFTAYAQAAAASGVWNAAVGAAR